MHATTDSSPPARQAPNELRWRIELLAEAGAILASSLDIRATLTAVSGLVIPALADLCVVYLIDEERGILDRAEVACSVPHKRDIIRRLQTLPTFSLAQAAPAFMGLSRGTDPLLLHELPPGFWSRIARGDEHRELLEALDIREILAVPLVARGRVLGAMALATIERDRRYTTDDITFVNEIGRRIAVAIDNARLFSNARDAAVGRDEARIVADTLLAAAPVGFIQLDRSLRVVRMNEAMTRLAGLPPQSALGSLGMTLPEVLDDAGRKLEASFRRVLDSNEPQQEVELDLDFPALGGQQRNVLLNVYPLRAANGDTQAIAGVALDVTERVRARRMVSFLATASRQLSETLDYEATVTRVTRLPLGVMADDCILWLSSSAGYPARVEHAHVDPVRDALTAAMLAVRPPRDDDELTTTVLRSGKSVVFESVTDDMLRAVAGDEENVRALLNALEIRSAIVMPLETGGRAIGAMAYIRSTVARGYDASEVALAEELTRRSAAAIDNARLFRETEYANRSKADFLATMSHELRTPLNAIAGYAELLDLEMHGPITAAQREDLRRIQRSQRHLLGLINDILNFAKLEAGRISFHLAAVPIARALAGIGEMVSPQAIAKGVHYSFVPCEPGLLVRADEEKLQQIVVNLLSNAVKFTDTGGRVTLRTDFDSQFVRIHVEDTGIGIPREELEQIFEPFVQVERGLSKPQEGTGLGLSISRELAKAMGGTLSAQSVQGMGSTFTLTLERAEERRRSTELRAVTD